MNNFSFHNPTKIHFGKGMVQKVPEEIPLDKRILITYGGGSVVANGILQQVKESLKNHPHLYIKGGIEPNPDYSTLMGFVDYIRENKIDFLLAVGGGSVVDGTKFIAHALFYDGEPWELIEKGLLPKQALPIGTVITLPATGSEMNNRAVISRRETNQKWGFVSPFSFPQFSIIDPEYCYTLPKKQLTNGIVDTFMHVMEQYMTRPNDCLTMDRWAEGVLLTLTEVGRELMANPKDYRLMSNFMLSATLALNDMIGMGMVQDWATHRLGYELTTRHGLDHAETLAVLFPNYLRIAIEKKKTRLVQMGQRVFNLNGLDCDITAQKTIDHIEQLFNDLGMNTRLSHYGIGEKDIEAIYHEWKKKNIAYGEDRDITAEIGIEILKMGLG